jgi:enoyl-CoA hydratase
MDFDNLLVENNDGIVTVTVNRPRALNALDDGTLKELLCCFRELENDQAAKVVLLTGGGEKAFVAGADIAAMQPLDAGVAREFARLGHRLMQTIEKLPKPVIAAVNGFALGGGCELALACDLRLASENAKFGQPEVNLGVIPGFGGTQRLARIVGKGRAMELVLSGDMIDAKEAWRIGLVNRVTSREELLAEATGLARKILQKGPFAVRLAKEAISAGLEMDLDRACSQEADLFALCFAGEDQKEGMQAFLEKRPARFQGR